MEIVINKCYGGFGVSLPCLWELVQRGSLGVERDKIGDYFGANNPKWADTSKARQEKHMEECRKWRQSYPQSEEAQFFRTLPDGWEVARAGSVLYDLRGGMAYSFDDRNARTDAKLIELLKEKGSEWASGRYAKLAIVDVPDGIEWELDEYDGIETIAEKHRSWG